MQKNKEFDPNKSSCINCAYWHPLRDWNPDTQQEKDPVSGECRRYAPRPIVPLIDPADRTSREYWEIRWVYTEHHHYCGEWLYYEGKVETRAKIN